MYTYFAQDTEGDRPSSFTLALPISSPSACPFRCPRLLQQHPRQTLRRASSHRSLPCRVLSTTTASPCSGTRTLKQMLGRNKCPSVRFPRMSATRCSTTPRHLAATKWAASCGRTTTTVQTIRSTAALTIRPPSTAWSRATGTIWRAV